MKPYKILGSCAIVSWSIVFAFAYAAIWTGQWAQSINFQATGPPLLSDKLALTSWITAIPAIVLTIVALICIE